MMKFKFLGLSLTGLLLSHTSPSLADNVADCEIVLLQTVEDESGRGGAQVASYGPADAFLDSVYNKKVDAIKDVGGVPIQAVMCKRIDIVPTDNDFEILATGVPLFLSQSFDSQNSDLISLFFKEGKFRQTYKGPGLTDETRELIETQLVEFNSREHDLVEKEKKLKTDREAEKAEREKRKDKDIKIKTEMKTQEEQVETKTKQTLKDQPKTVSEPSNKNSITSLKETAESEENSNSVEGE